MTQTKGKEAGPTHPRKARRHLNLVGWSQLVGPECLSDAARETEFNEKKWVGGVLHSSQGGGGGLRSVSFGTVATLWSAGRKRTKKKREFGELRGRCGCLIV